MMSLIDNGPATRQEGIMVRVRGTKGEGIINQRYLDCLFLRHIQSTIISCYIYLHTISLSRFPSSSLSTIYT
jgi:hypothetical protein